MKPTISSQNKIIPNKSNLLRRRSTSSQSTSIFISIIHYYKYINLFLIYFQMLSILLHIMKILALKNFSHCHIIKQIGMQFL